MTVKKYPCVYMRGGTSKAVFFHEKDLPADRAAWPKLFQRVMGTPDPKQIDGMGGGTSSTSKIAVISPSLRPGIDVDYYFVQVSIDQPSVSDNLNCGNISSAVGPFAIDEGLVPAVEPVTVVRIFNVNTGKVIEAHVPVEKGRAAVAGSAVIPGVPGAGAPIELYFVSPGGAATGQIFPTGKPRETLEIEGFPSIEASILDVSNVGVFVRARDLGLEGGEISQLQNDPERLEYLERIRGAAAVKLGFAQTWQEARTVCPAAPKIGILSPPQDYTALTGERISREDMDLCCRMLSLGTLHRAYPMTYAICTAAAALLPGTVAAELAALPPGRDVVRLGHTSGCTQVRVFCRDGVVEKAGILRTARRILDGAVYIPDK